MLACKKFLQGGAADILKMAMVAVDKNLRKEKIDARMLMSVHDELVLEARTGDKDGESLKAARRVLREGMVHAAGDLLIPVKLVLTRSEGASWREITEGKDNAVKESLSSEEL